MPGRKSSPSARINVQEADVFEFTGVDQENLQKRESTRSLIALFYVLGFLCIVFSALTVSFLKSLNINDIKDILITLSGILSGPLGFIIGYYFKASHENEQI